MTPYEEARRWLDHFDGTPAAEAIAKLVLSLRCGDCRYSFRECTTDGDERQVALALRLIGHYARIGDDYELEALSDAVGNRYPRLLELGRAFQALYEEHVLRWGAEDHQSWFDEQA